MKIYKKIKITKTFLAFNIFNYKFFYILLYIVNFIK